VRGKDETRIGRARTLRHSLTHTESLLWRRIRNRQLGGFKFVRQEPINIYYADFACRERRVIVELGQHAENHADLPRDERLSILGNRTIRIWNNDVVENIEGVLEFLLLELRK
jgi:very-short-patch-repair endonuclease